MTVINFDTKEGTSYIDKDVYEYICNNYPNKWFINNDGYLLTNKGKKPVFIHRLVFEANNRNIPENKEIDHINRNKLDNTKENLRIVNRSVNCFNKNKKENTSSKYIGVSWHKRDKKYESQIKNKGINYHLGYYDNELYAAFAYDIAKRKLLDNKASNYNNVDDLIDNETKEKIKNEVLARID